MKFSKFPSPDRKPEKRRSVNADHKRNYERVKKKRFFSRAENSPDVESDLYERLYGCEAGTAAALKLLLAVLAGFICSFGRMVGSPSYINVAVCAVAGSFSPAVLVGAAASCILQGNIAQQAIQLGSMLTLTALHIFFPHFSKNGDPIRLSLATAAITVMLSCIVSAGDLGSGQASMRMISSLLCACIVYAAAYLAEGLRCGEALHVRGLTAVYLAMIYIVSVATLCSVNIGMLNLGRTLACAAIPAAAKKRRAAGGAVMGAMTTIAVMMCSSSLAENTMLLAAAGLVCSAFCDFGRVIPAAAFMLSAAAALATTGLSSDTFNMLTDIIAGAAIFTAMPYNLFSKLMSRFIFLGNAADNAGQTASSRLNFAALTITDIRRRLAMISETVEARAEVPALNERIMEELCGGCRLYDDCRRNGCAARIDLQIKNGYDDPEAIGCLHAELLPDIIEKNKARQLADRAEAVKMRELRELLREQLATMSDMLGDLSFRLSRRREIDTKLSGAAKGYFERQGFAGVRACVYTDESLTRHIEVFLSGETEAPTLSLTAGLCRALELDLELPEITTVGNLTKLEFDELAKFTADFGSFSAAGSLLCSGDTAKLLNCSAGEKYLLISDGMGSGKRAQLDSQLSVHLAAKLLRSGISMSTAQRMINSVLCVKDWEEGFATLDLLRLDLFSGRAEFLRSGAAPAYLLRDGGVIKIECDSFPAGIFSSCDPDVYSCKLFDGDIILMATDGAPDDLPERAGEYCFERPEDEAEKIACALGTSCRADAPARADDLTIAVVKIGMRKKSRRRSAAGARRESSCEVGS